MSAPRLTLRLSNVQWLVAWGVVLDAALAHYGPAVGWGARLGLALLVGALFRTSPLRVPHGKRPAVVEGAMGGFSLVFLVALLGLVAPDDRSGLWLPPWIALLVLLAVDVAAVRRVGRLVGVEAVKLARNRVFLAGLVGTAAVTLLGAWLWTPPEEGASGWTMVGSVLGAGQWAAEVFLLVLGATAIAGEATGGTLKMMLPHAYARADWVRAKAATLLLAALAFTLVAAGIAVGATAVWRGFGDVFLPPLFGEEPEVFATADVLGSYLQQAVLAGLVALVVTGLLGLFLSSLFDGVVAALSFSFLLFLGLRFADIVLSLPLKVMHGIYAWYPGEMRDVLGQIGRAFSEAPWDPTFLPHALHLALLTAATAVLLAIAAFARRDIHA